jgi:two-component system NtrC family sensor kinase
MVELLDQVYASGQPFIADEMPMMLQRRQDQPPEERILSFVYQPLKEADGSVSGILAHGVDVTEQIRAQERLRTAEAHYRRLVENSPQAIYAVDAEGRFAELNPAGERLLERAAEDVIGQHFGAVLAPAEREGMEAVFERMISGEVSSTEFRERIRRPSGEERLLQITQTAILEDNSVLGVHGIARDITEERAQEQRMRLLAAALDRLPEGVSIVAPEQGFLYANAAHARLLGYAPERFSEVSPEVFLPDQAAREQLSLLMRTVHNEGSWSGRIQRKRLSDGQVIMLDTITGRVEDAGRELFFTIVRDATEAIAREQHLRRTERLASVGTLIGGVAHELNNPLHAIRNFAELMLLEKRDADDLEALQIIQREADRAAKVVSNLRLIARETQHKEAERTAVDLNDIVRHVLKVRRYSLETRNVEIREDLARNLPPVLANRSEIEQVVLNLVVNAEQAMQEQMEPRRLILRTRRTAEGASVYVVDSGPGIPPQHLERIFDPFFTTKSPGEGTGLGLSLAHSIVTEYGGEIHVDSEPGKGTAFRVDLPRAPTENRPDRDAAVPAAPTRSLRILVVDDEDAIRRVSMRFLERLGHRVDAAAEGGEALRLLEQADYDVILSDLRMPGLGGEELFTRLREQGRGMERRLIFVTGDTASAQAARVTSEADVPVLVKPVPFEELVRAVESATGERKRELQE